MLCPNCNSDLEVKETINQPNYTWRQKRCKECGYVFFTKEAVCESMDATEASRLFKEWTKERSRKARAKKKGINYEVSFEDGREQKIIPKRPTSPLF